MQPNSNLRKGCYVDGYSTIVYNCMSRKYLICTKYNNLFHLCNSGRFYCCINSSLKSASLTKKRLAVRTTSTVLWTTYLSHYVYSRCPEACSRSWPSRQVCSCMVQVEYKLLGVAVAYTPELVRKDCDTHYSKQEVVKVLKCLCPPRILSLYLLTLTTTYLKKCIIKISFQNRLTCSNYIW